jgi:hypothetical protein
VHASGRRAARALHHGVDVDSPRPVSQAHRDALLTAALDLGLAVERHEPSPALKSIGLTRRDRSARSASWACAASARRIGAAAENLYDRIVNARAPAPIRHLVAAAVVRRAVFQGEQRQRLQLLGQ